MKLRIERKNPDINAPRFRTQKWRHSFIDKELYKQFIEENPRYHVDYMDFKLICNEINKVIIDLVLHNKEGVLLPKGMGRMAINLFPSTKYLDYQGELDLTNVIGKICWDFKYTRYKIKHRMYYGFVAHRDFKRSTAACLKDNIGFYTRYKYLTTDYEYFKRKKLEQREREQFNNQISDQPGEDTSQGS